MRLFTTITLWLLLGCGAAQAAGPVVQHARDLQKDAALAQQKQVPVLVLFSSSYCGYCRVVREDFLEPMLKNAEYDSKVIIRVISIDTDGALRDFDGRMIDAETLAQIQNVYVTPTVKLFGPHGETLAPDLVGLSTVDFYGGYLDAAIDSSLQQLRQHKVVARNP